MRIYKILFCLALTLSMSYANAQVLVDVRVDSLQLLIGEQTDLTLGVTLGAKQKLQLPALRKGEEIIPNVEVIDVQRPDTNLLDEGKRMEIIQRYTITAWDSSLYYLPPFEVNVDGKKYKSKSLAIKVYTVDVDTLHIDKFFPPNGVMNVPFAWSDWEGIVYATFVLVLLLIVCVVLLYHIVNGKPIVRIIRRKKVLPPHKVAIDEIEKIKAARKWAEEDSKEYYTLLTDTLRTYIKDRYGFNAMEMTSAEIIERLIADNNEEALSELREIFTTADLVKFAKYNTLINENDANLVAALEYINQTKQEVDPNAKPEPEIIKETDKKRMNQVLAMKVLMGVLIVISICLTCWLIWRSIDILL
ncbi:MAG: BatD family protein [Bacteroidaceae bacterium]|nr:BatD family protein [Bacteroidaceae bacterium]